MQKSSGFIHVILLLVILAVVVVGGATYTYISLPKVIPVETDTPTSIQPSGTEWLTYVNNELEFSIQYPPETEAQEYQLDEQQTDKIITFIFSDENKSVKSPTLVSILVAKNPDSLTSEEVAQKTAHNINELKSYADTETYIRPKSVVQAVPLGKSSGILGYQYETGVSRVFDSFTYFANEKHIYQISAMTNEPTLKESFRDTYNKMLNTFMPL